jgi:hypothetical protein
MKRPRLFSKKLNKKISVFLLERARTAGDSILLFLRGQMPPFFMPKKSAP